MFAARMGWKGWAINKLYLHINSMITDQKKRYLKVSSPTLTSTQVEYFEAKPIPILVINEGRKQILVDSITLQFQSDSDIAAVYQPVECGWTLGPGEMKEQIVQVCPNPKFLQNTNTFKIKVDFRIDSGKGLGPRQAEIHAGGYLIVRTSTKKVGKLFVSFKQNEDLSLARIFQRLGARAGFEVYLAIHDSQPGNALWDRIEPELQASSAAIILWTRHTEWGGGVEKEIELCRKHGIKEVLLIEHGIRFPSLYDGTDKEYLRFDPDDPFPAFSKVITAQRKM
jgi:hypothetical protein